LAILLDMTKTHQPVLAAELVGVVDPSPGEVAVDCTFGGGGHARLVAERLGSQGTLVCIDRDPAAADRFEEFSEDIPCKARFLRTDFAAGLELLASEGFECDVAYLDLGVSSMQIDAWERGFSYAYDAPLDMRMDPTQDLDARELINHWDERRLTKTFQVYGEERYSRQIARAVCERRRRLTIETTHDLVETIKSAIPDPARFAGGHPARRVFQAIRIAVNGELESLDRALPAAWSLLRPGGRLGAISFHSLEDRRVKRFFSERARGCVCPPEFPVCVCNRDPEAELLTRRGVVPSAQELADNPRSRSARLRAARKLASEEGA
jgi:16S rRNA (cytosine1402-N4)-methyltransferase